MKININKIIALSPMAGYSNFSFRYLIGKYGADLTLSEFINVEYFRRLNKKIKLKRIVKCPKNSFSGVQFFGTNPEAFRDTILIINEMNYTYKPKFIDINMGCPAPKVVRTGAGALLLENKELIKKIANTFQKYCELKYTAKLRIPQNQSDLFEIIKILEDCSFFAITLHARTKNQNYSSQPNIDIYHKLKDKFNIPIIANPSINSPIQADYFLNKINCDGVMIGRAALLNPFIFSQIKEYFKTKTFEPITLNKKIKFFLEYLKVSIKNKEDFSYSKKFALKLFRGFYKATKLRLKISKTNSFEELAKIVEEFGRNQL
jgi:nifR3 family TIM-barrel protein